MSTRHSPERRARFGAWALAALLGLAAAGQVRADDVRAERSRIAAERTAIELRHTTAQAECAQRFIVTTCADDARQQRRLALEALNRQTLAIDEAERRRQAAARLRSIDAKAASHAARQASDAASGGSQALPASLIPRGDADPARTPRAVQGAAARATRTQQMRAREAVTRVTERDERRKAADEHRAAVEKRLRERQASGRAAAPLPSPSGATP